MITITVSRIKTTWLRRLVMIFALPFCLIVAVAQAALFGAIVILCEPFARAWEVCCVMAAMVPTFKQQWADGQKEPS